jgi:hypothetical protein
LPHALTSSASLYPFFSICWEKTNCAGRKTGNNSKVSRVRSRINHRLKNRRTVNNRCSTASCIWCHSFTPACGLRWFCHSQPWPGTPLKTPIPFPQVNDVEADLELGVGLTGGTVAQNRVASDPQPAAGTDFKDPLKAYKDLLVREIILRPFAFKLDSNKT